jgi:hypothetical protein
LVDQKACVRDRLSAGRPANSRGAWRPPQQWKKASEWASTSIVRMLHEELTFSETFMAYLLARNARVEEDLVDQLFNSSEKRLARLLLLMANFGKEGRPEPAIAQISQATLAGTTRSRVNFL